MSAPAQNAPGAPASTIARMASLAAASRSDRVITSYIGCVSAFFFSGRFSRMVRTPPSSATRT